jgi:nicotinamidase/pyrazinamidase
MHMPAHALILVDLQPDFLPGGALAVTGRRRGGAVRAARHARVRVRGGHARLAPRDHGSFASQHPGKQPGELIELNGLTQVLWPDHCVQGTPGAALCKELDPASITRVFRKGSDPGVDSYSGFFDNGRRNATGLGDWLRAEGITALSVLGLATDYCVKFTALDARDLGFDVTLLTQGCRGVELHAGDVARALDELRSAGVHVRE